MRAGHTSEFIVEQILPDVRRGRMVIIVDSEERENEGDLFVAAEKVDRGAHAQARHRPHYRRYRQSDPLRDGFCNAD
jgi:hypothetical protein